ncbi:glycosyltransferase family 2 protein [Ruegeria profundi]|uniref:glycosyltransferase family 2 protein n=1 Tax=Ruegeria profundi TaxID=1685378 RepID=UPI001CD29368|nr:glycosyltransferase family 2 protein [Ruegeria profundi]MCA0930412.1 glycosyltransferase [Ruegeria profundi]
MNEVTEKQISALQASGQFDPDWYRRTYPDVDMTGMDPARHYLNYGHRLNRDPGPDVSTLFIRTAYGMKEQHEPIARLNWMRRKAGEEPVAPNSKRVLKAANLVARAGDHARAIALAEAHLPSDLAYTAGILRANAALAQADEDGWQLHLNSYLERFGLTPIQLNGVGTVFDRLTCAVLPSVTGGELISVIMPAWNAEKTVEKAARSILDQTWRNLELLVVDDASTDGTWAVLKRIAASDDRVKILRNKVNVGPYVSKNIALTQAKGAWITGHDSDDWAHPQRLAQHLEETKARNLQASVAYMLRITPSGTFSYITQQSSFSLDGAARKALISCLFDRKVLSDTLGYWDAVRFGADSEMIMRAETALGSKFGVVEQIAMICQDLETSLTNHPIHGVSKQTGVSPVRANYRDAWTKWLEGAAEASHVHLKFPQKGRRYDAASEMVVSWRDQLANLSEPRT